jgi:hypothetical protein
MVDDVLTFLKHQVSISDDLSQQDFILGDLKEEVHSLSVEVNVTWEIAEFRLEDSLRILDGSDSLIRMSLEIKILSQIPGDDLVGIWLVVISQVSRSKFYLFIMGMCKLLEQVSLFEIKKLSLLFVDVVGVNTKELMVGDVVAIENLFLV